MTFVTFHVRCVAKSSWWWNRVSYFWYFISFRFDKTVFSIFQVSRDSKRLLTALLLSNISPCVSDARLFCKNKQENLKNKPKIGNLSEKQAQYALAGKFNKTKNQQENYIKKQGGKSEKTNPKWANFHKNTPNVPLAVNWNSKSAIKFDKTSNPQNRNLQKTSPKTSKFQLKQAQK